MKIIVNPYSQQQKSSNISNFLSSTGILPPVPNAFSPQGPNIFVGLKGDKFTSPQMKIVEGDGNSSLEKRTNQNSSLSQTRKNQVGMATFFSPAANKPVQSIKISSTTAQQSPNNATLTNLKNGSAFFGKESHRLNHSMVLAQRQLSKEAIRIDRLKQTRHNALVKAQEDLKKHLQKIEKEQTQWAKFEDLKLRKMHEDQKRKINLEQRRLQAKEALNQQIRAFEQQSQTNYDWRIKDLEQLRDSKQSKERNMSLRSYKDFKKKVEETEFNYKKRIENIKQEDLLTGERLESLESKMHNGQEKARQRITLTQSKATRYSSIHLEKYKNYQSLVESNQMASIEKARTKDQLIGLKVSKKTQEQFKQTSRIRDILTAKFDRNRNGKSILSHELEMRKKQTIDRREQKEKLKEILMEQQELQMLKRKEINQLKKQDVQENINKQKNDLMNMKMRWINKFLSQPRASPRDPYTHHKHLQKQLVQYQKKEREIIEQINPKEVLLNARLQITLQKSRQNSPKRSGKKSQDSQNQLIKGLTNSINVKNVQDQ